MAIVESEARRLVIEAGHRLVAEGLIARTWGNISARISDTQFVVTPSGLAYDTLREDQLVIVNIADCSYDGDIKPSSEKGLHADCYALRDDVDFIIHTHQFYASCVGLSGKDLPVGDHPLLGSHVPCAPYGLPGTNALRKAVVSSLKENPDSKAAFMLHHGAVCMGRDYEEAFAVAQALESVSKAAYDTAVAPLIGTNVRDFGTSVRENDNFVLMLDGIERQYALNALPTDAPEAAKIHAAIYQSTDARCVLHEAHAETVAVSSTGKTLRPRIDDLAMIAGVTVRSAKNAPNAIAAALKNRNAVLVQGAGALCIGIDRDDAEAVCMILHKCCAAERYAEVTPDCKPISRADALLQRLVYQMKYAKQKAKG